MKRATYEDVLNAPENKVAEILDGELVLSPRPGPRHAAAAWAVGRAIGGAADGGPDDPGGWFILNEPELHLAEHVLVPDIAGWRRERLPALPEDEAFFSVAADSLKEKLSPSTERIDRGRKLRAYAEAGVANAWLVKPTDRTLEVLQLREGAWVILGVFEDAARVRAEPFADTEFDLARFWAAGRAPDARP
jgi:Uma2 family endonuclease